MSQPHKIMTYKQFKQQIREKEALEGPRQIVVHGQITSVPFSEDEIKAMYESRTVEDPITGVNHFDEIIGGPNVLSMKDNGKFQT